MADINMAYLRQDGTKVSIGCLSLCVHQLVQVFLVAGGRDGTKLHSSTELLVEGSDAWTMSTPLPRAVRGVRGATLGNIDCITGGEDKNYNEIREILAWSEERKEW